MALFSFMPAIQSSLDEIHPNRMENMSPFETPRAGSADLSDCLVVNTTNIKVSPMA
jgi:hypothetical protein